MSKAKINKVVVVGTVREVATEIRQTSDGREYISGKIVIGVGENSAVEMKLFTLAKKKDGTDNKMFASYKALDGMLEKRVHATGTLREGSMIAQDNGRVIHFNEISLGFVNAARQGEEDGATFEYSGFVVKGLTERRTKDDELIGYRLEVAQANYNDTSMDVIRFDVDKNDINIAEAIESNYLVGSTVSFSGVISYTTRIETKTVEVAFGEPQVKQYVANDKVYRITSGQAPLDEDHPECYTQSEIAQFVQAYKDADVKRLVDATTVVEEAPAAPAGAAGMAQKTRPASLI